MHGTFKLEFYLLSTTNVDHTMHTLVSVSSGNETSFTLPSKMLTTSTPSYTLLTSVETNIGESTTQLESTTVALPQTRYTQLHTPSSSKHYTIHY